MIEEVTARYLGAVDEALPGFVQMLYLTGSVALGAYQPGRSDIDTLIVTSREPDADDLTALAAVHAGMPSEPHFDGIYLDQSGLRRQPSDRPVVPFVVNGEFRTDKACGDLNPVLWLIMARYGVPVRGPAVAELDLTLDRAGLRRFNLDNLRTYWAPLADELRKAVADQDDPMDIGNDPVGPEGLAWCLLGPARLHYTLASGDVIPKPRVGEYLADAFPQWAELAVRTVRWRDNEPVGFTVADVRAAADSIDAVVADAWRRWG
jgi:hypothetical protein